MKIAFLLSSAWKLTKILAMLITTVLMALSTLSVISHWTLLGLACLAPSLIAQSSLDSL
jgi:hypothetical protein